MVLAAGDIVGKKYLLVRPRSRGARSIVWEAEHLVLRRRCALKIFDAHGNASLPRAAEVRATASLDHPSIARLHDVFTEHEHDVYVFAMPLFDGEVLHRLIAVRGRFAAERIAALLVQLLDGLGHALARGVSFPHASTHQLLVTAPAGSERREEVKLLGFGRPIPHALANADALLEGEAVRAITGILQECVAAMPPEVDGFLSDAKAQPSLAEMRRVLVALTIGRKARG